MLCIIYIAFRNLLQKQSLIKTAFVVARKVAISCYGPGRRPVPGALPRALQTVTALITAVGSWQLALTDDP
jgi:hypothetical protein